MESAVIDKEKTQEKTAELEQAGKEKVEQAKPKSSEWVIQRPKRKTVTEEEALEWTKSFAAERKESFIAAIRESKG